MDKYMHYVKKKNDICDVSKHCAYIGNNWRRHCPQYEVMCFNEYNKLNL